MHFLVESRLANSFLLYQKIFLQFFFQKQLMVNEIWFAPCRFVLSPGRSWEVLGGPGAPRIFYSVRSGDPFTCFYLYQTYSSTYIQQKSFFFILEQFQPAHFFILLKSVFMGTTLVTYGYLVNKGFLESCQKSIFQEIHGAIFSFLKCYKVKEQDL